MLSIQEVLYKEKMSLKRHFWNATIVCGVTIGEYALIGAGAVVNKDVKPYALMVGVPARQIGWVGISGNTLHFDEKGKAEDEFAEYILDEENLKVYKKWQ